MAHLFASRLFVSATLLCTSFTAIAHVGDWTGHYKTDNGMLVRHVPGGVKLSYIPTLDKNPSPLSGSLSFFPESLVSKEAFEKDFADRGITITPIVPPLSDAEVEKLRNIKKPQPEQKVSPGLFSRLSAYLFGK